MTFEARRLRSEVGCQEVKSFKFTAATGYYGRLNRGKMGEETIRNRGQRRGQRMISVSDAAVFRRTIEGPALRTTMILRLYSVGPRPKRARARVGSSYGVQSS